MRKRLTSIDPGTCAKVLTVVYGLIGIIGAVIFFIAGLLSQSPGAAIGIAFVVPFVYAIGGLIGGYLGALLYNVVAELTGGFVFTLDDDVIPESQDSTVVFSKPQ
jgi:hypothetical protein